MPDSAVDTSPSLPNTPPPLSERYHKTHTLCALVSGLSLASSFHGVEADGTYWIGLRINPGVFPDMLCALVVWFLSQTTIQWFQCDERRRALRASLAHIGSILLLGAIALGVYGWKHFGPIRFVYPPNVVAHLILTLVAILLYGSALGLVSREGFRLFRRWMFENKSADALLLTLAVLWYLSGSALQMVLPGGRPAQLLLGLAVLAVWLLPRRVFAKLLP